MLDGQVFIMGKVDLALAQARCSLEVQQLASGFRFIEGLICGQFEPGDLAVILRKMEQTPLMTLNMPTLWDMRELDFEGQNPTDFRATLYALPMFPERRNTRRGLLVSNEIGFGMMRMHQETAAAYNIDKAESFKVSYSRTALITWLNAPS